jgi:hypothetical protein
MLSASADTFYRLKHVSHIGDFIARQAMENVCPQARPQLAVCRQSKGLRN